MSDPFEITEQTLISLSGGRSSAYMLRCVLDSHKGKLPPDTAVCFANTGKEDHLTLDFVNDISYEWNVPIHWVEFRDNARGYAFVDYHSASREGEPFEALIKKKSYLPNAVARFCTSDLKIKPINAFLKDSGWGEFQTMLGIRADEPRRIAKMPHMHKPLAIAGITKPHVIEFFKGQRYDLKADDSNCDLCFLKGLPQIMSRIRKRPDTAIWWAKQEGAVGARFSKDRPTYEQMHRNALDQGDMIGYDEETIACFCGD